MSKPKNVANILLTAGSEFSNLAGLIADLQHPATINLNDMVYINYDQAPKVQEPEGKNPKLRKILKDKKTKTTKKKRVTFKDQSSDDEPLNLEVPKIWMKFLNPPQKVIVETLAVLPPMDASPNRMQIHGSSGCHPPIPRITPFAVPIKNGNLVDNKETDSLEMMDLDQTIQDIIEKVIKSERQPECKQQIANGKSKPDEDKENVPPENINYNDDKFAGIDLKFGAPLAQLNIDTRGSFLSSNGGENKLNLFKQTWKERTETEPTTEQAYKTCTSDGESPPKRFKSMSPKSDVHPNDPCCSYSPGDWFPPSRIIYPIDTDSSSDWNDKDSSSNDSSIIIPRRAIKPQKNKSKVSKKKSSKKRKHKHRNERTGLIRRVRKADSDDCSDNSLSVGGNEDMNIDLEGLIAEMYLTITPDESGASGDEFMLNENVTFEN